MRTSVYRQWVPCEHNSSYNFIPIFLKLCTCFLHGLKMCMWFGYNPCINFCYFFNFVNFVIFWPQIIWKVIDSGYLVSAAPHTIWYWSFLNFAHVFSMVLMCVWFGYNPWINFCHFFNFLTSDCMKVYRQWVPCKRNSLYNFIVIFFKLCTCFLHGLEMCLWFGYGGVNFLIFWPQILWKCIASGYLVSATPYTISILSSCSFAHLFSMVWRCACGLDLILQLIFVTFPLC